MMQCEKCHKFLVNEEHRQKHPCKHWLIFGDETLEVAKKKVFDFYADHFLKKRQEIFQNVFPLVSFTFLRSDIGKVSKYISFSLPMKQ